MHFGVFDHLDRYGGPLLDFYEDRLKLMEAYDRAGIFGGRSLVLAVVTFFYLTDRPAEAQWLADDERGWLKRRLEAEDARREAEHLDLSR